MPAYVVTSFDVTDPAGLDDYRAKVGPVIAPYCARVLAVGTPEVTEGEPKQVGVLIEFPSMEQAWAWYDCAEYQDLKALRLRSTQGTLWFLDGLPAQ